MPRSRYEVDASQADRAYQGITKRLEEIDKVTERVGKRMNTAERQGRKFAELADPQKKYNRQMDELAASVQKGHTRIEDARRVAQKYQQRLEGVGRAGKSAFGSQALSRLGAYTTGVFSVGTAINQVRQFYSALSAEADAAADRVRDSLDAIGELQQLSDFAGNREAVKDLRRRGIAGSASQGAEIIRGLSRAGVRGDDREFLLTQLGEPKVVAPENIGTFASTTSRLNESFGFGGFQPTAQKLIQAAELADTEAIQLGEAGSKVGSDFTSAGFSGDAGLAALATLARTQGARRAGSQLRELVAAFEKRGLSKGTFAESFAGVQARVAGGADIRDVLGSETAVSGFQGLAPRFDTFRQNVDLIGTAATRNVIGQRAGNIYNDPTLNASLIEDQTRGAAEVLDEELFGRQRALLRSVRHGRTSYEKNRGNRFGAYVFEQRADWNEFFGTEANFVAAALQAEVQENNIGDGGALNSSTEQEIIRLLRGIHAGTVQGARASAQTAEALQSVGAYSSGRPE